MLDNKNVVFTKSYVARFDMLNSAEEYITLLVTRKTQKNKVHTQKAVVYKRDGQGNYTVYEPGIMANEAKDS